VEGQWAPEVKNALLGRWESICDERGVELLDLAVGEDHVHALIALRPTHNVASVVREVKGRAGLELLMRHPELRVWLGGNLVWDERYAVETISATRTERVQSRLRALHPHRRAESGGLDGLAAAS
jgi:putative transposase